MLDVRLSEAFEQWLLNLRDIRARARINARIERLTQGNFGDAKFFGGIGELRIDYGPGYRVYFVRIGDQIVVVLAGGDKSTQPKDIERALWMAKELKDSLE